MLNPKNRQDSRLKNLSAWLPIIFLLLVALALRLIGADSRSFHNDELSALFRLQVGEFNELIEKSITPDYHPALIQTLLYYWTKLTGYQPWLVRLPFVMAGVASVWLTHLLGERWFGKGTAWLAAASFALLQFPILYSQLARPYSTGVLFILAATTFWDRLIRPLPGSWIRSKLVPAAGMAVCFALSMYNHYFSFLVAGMIGVTGLFLLRKETVLPYLISGFASILLFLPHLNISITQVARGGLDLWLAPPDAQWLASHFTYLFNNSYPLLIFVLIISLPFLIRLATPRSDANRRMQWINFLWFFIPLSFAFGWSLLINPILQHSIMLFAFPFLLLALFSGYGKDGSHLSRGVIVLYPLILLSHLLWGAGYYRTEHYTGFETMGEEICIELTRENTVWAVDVNNPWYIHYYMNPGCNPDSALFYLSGKKENLPEIQAMLDTLTADGIVYARLRPADPMVPELMMQYFPNLVFYRDDGLYGELFSFRRKSGTTPRIIDQKDTITILQTDLVPIPQQDSFAEFVPLLDLQMKSINPASKYQSATIRCVLSNVSMPWPQEQHLVIELKDRNGKPKVWSGLQPGIMNPVDGRYVIVSRLPEKGSVNDLLQIYLWNPNHKRIPHFSAEVQAVVSTSSPKK
ncbi:MAG: glycosyltransferase family 39 protein [Bacteroidales bacterium]